jgi:hypothetical protein
MSPPNPAFWTVADGYGARCAAPRRAADAMRCDAMRLLPPSPAPSSSLTLAPRPAAQRRTAPRRRCDAIAAAVSRPVFLAHAQAPPARPGPPAVHTQFDLVCYMGSEAFVENGNLVLRTRRGDAFCGGKPFQYVSGWIDTQGKLSVRGGRVEVRARLPPPTFRVWPASFLISELNDHDTGVCWPLTAEIDLYEVAGGFDNNLQANTGLGLNALCASSHYGSRCFVDEGASFTGCKSQFELDPAAAFHTYAAEWNLTSVVYSIDGEPFFVQTSDKYPGMSFPDPMIVILQTALAWWILPQDASAPPAFPPGQDYTFHFIDWVRVWRRSA